MARCSLPSRERSARKRKAAASNFSIVASENDHPMKTRVTGIGGIFFKAKNTKKMQAWYKKHLGLPLDPSWGGWSFEWRDAKDAKKKGTTVWSAFEANTKYFGRGKQSHMLNYRVANLPKVLAQLKKEG